MTPKRVQRKRVKGYKLPENTICVNRPLKFGNPFKLVDGSIYVDARHRLKKWEFFCKGDAYTLVELFDGLLTRNDSTNEDILFWVDHFKALDLGELKGKNLACFCPLDKPCHADSLLIHARKADAGQSNKQTHRHAETVQRKETKYTI